MTQLEIRNFRDDFQKAVIQLEKQYGVNIGLGAIRYDDNGLRTKMTAVKGTKIDILDKNDFQVGDTITIDHKKINPNTKFTIIKINKVNIKVRSVNGARSLVVSPSLLRK